MNARKLLHSVHLVFTKLFYCCCVLKVLATAHSALGHANAAIGVVAHEPTSDGTGSASTTGGGPLPSDANMPEAVCLSTAAVASVMR